MSLEMLTVSLPDLLLGFYFAVQSGGSFDIDFTVLYVSSSG